MSALSFVPSVPGAGFASALPALMVVVVVAGLLGSFIVSRQRKRAKEASLARLLARDTGWTRVAAPCGLTAEVLAARTAATPRGDRRYGVRWGIGGPLELPINGRETRCEASFFQWFSEQESTSTSSQGNVTRSYRECLETVAMVRLPVTGPTVRIRPESLFGRMGLTRGGDQVESSEFNRRFRVDGDDRTLTVQLLDANLQQHLLERFRGRSVDLTADLLVLGGRPDHRDDSLTGVVGEFPAIRQDLELLVRQFPGQFWRAIGATGPGAHEPDGTVDRGV